MSYFPETFTIDNLSPSKKKLEKDLAKFQKDVERGIEKEDMYSLPIIFNYNEPDSKTKFAIAKELHAKFPDRVRYLCESKLNPDGIIIWKPFTISSTEENTRIIRGLRLQLYDHF